MLLISIGATIVVILVSTFLAYKLAVYCGVNIERRTLFLCIVMAMICNCVAMPSMMYFPVSHLSIIAFTAVASTIFITYYNHYLVQKKTSRKERLRRRSKQMMVTVEQTAQGQAIDTVLQCPEPALTYAPLKNDSKALVSYDKIKILPQVNFYSCSWHLSQPEQKACDKLLSNKSLDEIMEYACLQWRKKMLRHSLYGLFTALDKYGDDPAALFICIEISNIYKSLGAYRLAAVSLQAAKYLPVACGNVALQRDLREQIAYLHRLIAVLQSVGMPQIPIEEVPDEWLRRADALDVDNGNIGLLEGTVNKAI